jgi:AcrR family transcriptional regulator
MPRVGLTTDRVVMAATELVDGEGADALTLARLAERLDVKAPSLYNHVDGLEDVRRGVGLRTVDMLAGALGSAVMGRSGTDALQALAAAYRDFAVRHPGLYPLSQVAHPEDAEWSARSFAAVEPVAAVLHGYGLDGDDAIHAVRVLRSALHGFVLLEIGGGFGLDLDLDDTFRRMVDLLSAALSALAGGRSTVPG